MTDKCINNDLNKETEYVSLSLSRKLDISEHTLKGHRVTYCSQYADIILNQDHFTVLSEYYA